MRVQLVDIDSRIPNLALMQISAYHKQLGDVVGFDVAHPDLVYVSCIFSKNAGQARGVAGFYPNSHVIFGGSGFYGNLKYVAISEYSPLLHEQCKKDMT